MRRPQLALLLAATALALAACSSSTTPGWTYAPPTPAPTPGPSVEPSAAPSDAAPSDAAPSDAAPSDAAPSDGGAGGEKVAISALNIMFEQTEVAAPADTPFQIEFENKDAGIPHNVDIKDASGGDFYVGEIFPGVATKTYDIPAIPAGSYTFICTVHPNMVGTLKVGG